MKKRTLKQPGLSFVGGPADREIRRYLRRQMATE